MPRGRALPPTAGIYLWTPQLGSRGGLGVVQGTRLVDGGVLGVSRRKCLPGSSGRDPASLGVAWGTPSADGGSIGGIKGIAFLQAYSGIL
jgi:hypothetical protein